MRHRKLLLVLAVVLVAGYWWTRRRQAAQAAQAAAPVGVGNPSDTPAVYDVTSGYAQAPALTSMQQNASEMGLVLAGPGYESPVGLAGGLGSYQGSALVGAVPAPVAPPITDATDPTATSDQTTAADFMDDLSFTGAGSSASAGQSPVQTTTPAQLATQNYYVGLAQPAGTDQSGQPSKPRSRHAPLARQHSAHEKTQIQHTPARTPKKARGAHKPRTPKHSAGGQLAALRGGGSG